MWREDRGKAKRLFNSPQGRGNVQNTWNFITLLPTNNPVLETWWAHLSKFHCKKVPVADSRKSQLPALQSLLGQLLTEEDESCCIASSHFKDWFHFGRDITLLTSGDIGYLVCIVTHCRWRPGHNAEGQVGFLDGLGHSFHSSVWSRSWECLCILRSLLSSCWS